MSPTAITSADDRSHHRGGEHRPGRGASPGYSERDDCDHTHPPPDPPPCAIAVAPAGRGPRASLQCVTAIRHCVHRTQSSGRSGGGWGGTQWGGADVLARAPDTWHERVPREARLAALVAECSKQAAASQEPHPEPIVSPGRPDLPKPAGKPATRRLERARTAFQMKGPRPLDVQIPEQRARRKPSAVAGTRPKATATGSAPVASPMITRTCRPLPSLAVSKRPVELGEWVSEDPPTMPVVTRLAGPRAPHQGHPYPKDALAAPGWRRTEPSSA